MAKERQPDVINKIREEKLKIVRDLGIWCDSHINCDACCFAEAAHHCSISDINDHYFIKEVKNSMKPEKKEDKDAND